ncbi:MAG: hypothetical protein AAGD38_14945 [Acidobacteriota bacterium]
MFRSMIRVAVVVCLATVLSFPARGSEAERLFAEATRLDNASDLAAALDAYRLLIDRFAATPEAAEALARSAELQWARDDSSAAERLIETLRSRHPTSAATARGELLAGTMAMDRAGSLADLAAARTILLRVPLGWDRGAFPDLQARARARVAAAQIAFLLGDLDTAIAEALLVAEDEPRGDYSAEAELLWARASLAANAELAPILEVLQRNVIENEGEAIGREAKAWLSLLHRRRIGPSVGRPWIDSARPFAATTMRLEEATGVAADGDSIVVTDGSLPLIAILGTDESVRVRTAITTPRRPWWDVDRNAAAVGDDVLVRPFGGRRIGLTSPRGRDDALSDIEAATDDLFGGWWAIARRYDDVLLRYNTVTQPPREVRLQDTRDLQDVARDDRGRLYALDRDSQSVHRLDADGRGDEIVARGDWKRAAALAIDRLGYLWVLDSGTRRVEMWDASGRLLMRLGPNLPGGIELRDPVDIAVDGAGRVYLADEDLTHLVVLD